jgi:hypothetical protein
MVYDVSGIPVIPVLLCAITVAVAVQKKNMKKQNFIITISLLVQ